MMLLVDTGNSAIKWAFSKAGGLVGNDRFVHRGEDISGQLTRCWGTLQTPTGMYIANVAGKQMGEALTDWTRRQWSQTPEFISSSAAACGVKNAYSDPETLGVDRWAALIGAHHHTRGAVCIIDCGTAITLDVLLASGQHQGGLILPGIEMLKQALQEDTAEVRSSAEVQAASVIVSSTGAAVHGGAVYMAVAAIDRIINDITVTHEQDFEVVITGGDAGTILTLLAHPARHDPALVLKGLAILAGEH
jgi:type III pantothenate kinase